MPSCFPEKTIVLPYNYCESLEALFGERERKSPRSSSNLSGECGLDLPEPAFLDFLLVITAKGHALFIFDEVMTGFRVARGGYQELLPRQARPFLLRQGIGWRPAPGLGRAEIDDHRTYPRPVYQAGTLSGNPLAMVAGLTSRRKWNGSTAGCVSRDWGGLRARDARSVGEKAGKNHTFHRQAVSSSLLHRQTCPQSRRRHDPRQSRLSPVFLEGPGTRSLFAPSPFEAGFLSLAHVRGDRETVAIAEKALAA